MNQMSMAVETANLRRDPRISLNCRVQLNWEGPDGAMLSCWGRARDYSQNGIGMLVPERMTRGTRVYIRLENGRTLGAGTVRYTIPVMGKNLIGIELVQPFPTGESLPA